ncbi:MAG: hypothetical protein IPH93_04365 [Saprospiraceae bacterium]|nr:hypothetical protein [Saprospiraceae bacterium]MBK9631797.1 hypothetical protein [Saprospiraceae bacterium]
MPKLKLLQSLFYLAFSQLFIFSINAQTVYHTPYGQKYHRGNCRMVENVSSSITLDKAINNGLDPCKICKPPTLSSLQNVGSNKERGVSNSTEQCRGITRAGARCRHMTSIGNGYCFQHNPDRKIIKP